MWGIFDFLWVYTLTPNGHGYGKTHKGPRSARKENFCGLFMPVSIAQKCFWHLIENTNELDIIENIFFRYFGEIKIMTLVTILIYPRALDANNV